MAKIKFPNSNIKCLSELNNHIDKSTEDIEIEITEGVYFGNLVFDNLSHKVKMIAHGSVVFTGAKSVECNFKRYNSKIIVAEIDKDLTFERVMYRGENLIPARYPNYEKDELLNGVTTYDNLEKRLTNYNVKKGYLRSLHKHEWGGNSYYIKGVDNGRLQLKWLGDNNRGSDFKSDCVMAEYIFEELDSENEWYYDAENGLFYLYDDTTFEGKKTIDFLVISELVTIKNCHNGMIYLHGIEFSNTDRSMFKAVWKRYLRSDWAYNSISTIGIDNSDNIFIENCNFNNLGANCIGIFNNSTNISIKNCDFIDSFSNGVLVLGSPDSTYCSSSWDNHITIMESEEKKGAKCNDYPKNITIENCYFYNLGIMDKQSAAICLSLAYRTVIKNCTIHHLPRAGINISENAFGGNIIEGCDVFDCVRETGDHGPFNSWGRDRYWSLKRFNTTGKYGKIKKQFALADMLESNYIRNSRFVGERGFGIDLDDGSSNYIIEDNFCFNVGIKIREGFFRQIRNNTIINAPLDIHATFCKSDDVIENNKVFSSKPLAVIILNKGFNTKIANNYFYNASASNKNNKILKKQKNTWVDNYKLDLATIVQNDCYGVIGKPKPNFSFQSVKLESVIKNNKYGVFSEINDTIRSLTGSDNYEGIFVEKIKFISMLKKFAVKKGDIIKKVNDNAIDINTFNENIKNAKNITVYRNHSIIRLEK